MNEMGMIPTSEDPIIMAMALLLGPLALCVIFEFVWLWAKGFKE